MLNETVVVLGASPNPERYANRAVRMLLDHGHRVLPVHPVAAAVHGVACVSRPAEITEPVDTVSIYVGPDRSDPMVEDLLRLRPRRLIFNPGTENPVLAQAARAAGIQVLDACTLVLLSTGQF